MSLKFKTVKSDRLFYDQFKYSVSFRLQECWVYRYTFDPVEIDERLTRQQEWRERMQARWPGNGMNRYHSPITDGVRLAVKMMADFIKDLKHPHKIIITSNQLRIYTSDLDLLYTVSRLGYITQRKYAEVWVDRPKNTVRIKNPRHKFRSYFKELQITQDDKLALAQFLGNQSGIRIGAGLKSWLEENPVKYSSKYTRDYFFIDHDSDQWLTMLALVRPGLIRKTMDIIAK